MRESSLRDDFSSSSLRKQGPIRRFLKIVTGFRQYRRHGVWVSAFAGTTERSNPLRYEETKHRITKEHQHMIIDFHVHVLPPEEWGIHRHRLSQEHRRQARASRRARSRTCSKAAEIGGVDISVICNPLHNLRDMDRKQQLERCQVQNRFHAEMQAKYHGNIVGMASTVPYGGDEFLREFERAIKQDGLKGAWILSSLQGNYPDDDEAHAVLPAGAGARRAGRDPSAVGRLRRGAHARLPARVERRPADGRRARGRAADRARRVREIPEAQAGRAPISAAASAR